MNKKQFFICFFVKNILFFSFFKTPCNRIFKILQGTFCENLRYLSLKMEKEIFLLISSYLPF